MVHQTSHQTSVPMVMFYPVGRTFCIKHQCLAPVVPPATKVSIKTQTDPQPESEEPGSSQQREEPASSVGPQQGEVTVEKKKDINADDTAPEKKL